MDKKSVLATESSLAVFSGAYCRGEEVVTALAEATGLRVVSDQDLVLAAMDRSGLSESTIARVFQQNNRFSISLPTKKNAPGRISF
jgi:hypothetical protein